MAVWKASLRTAKGGKISSGLYEADTENEAKTLIETTYRCVGMEVEVLKLYLLWH